MSVPCTYCGTKLKRGRNYGNGYTIDHVIPRFMLRSATNRNVNLTHSQRLTNRVACCYNCNSRKDNMDPREWIKTINDPHRRKAVEAILGLLPVNLVYGEPA